MVSDVMGKLRGRTGTAWGTVVASIGVFAAGCGENSVAASVGSSQQGVETSYLGVYYELAFAPAPALADVRAKFPDAGADQAESMFARELALQGQPYWASGSITVPLLDEPGGQPLSAPAPADSPIRASCGATLITPSLVITAGHCVTTDSDLTKLRLQMYRPTPRLVETYGPAAKLTGTWPQWTHPVLGEADGYFIDEYPCQVLSRCYYGFDSNCPSPGTDVALLKCDGSPGAKYGFLNQSSGDLTGKEAHMQWKHEVYDLGKPPLPADITQHYVNYPTDKEQNYHYFEKDNRLLPLRSARWASGEVPRFISAEYVDIHGCHGSSGSGILVRNGETPEYRLVAPVAVGGDSFSSADFATNYLCQQSGNPVAPIAPGARAIGINWPAPGTLLTPRASEISADCRNRPPVHGDVDGLPFAAGTQRVSTVFTHLDCQLAEYATPLTEDLHPVALSPYPQKYLDEPTTDEHKIAGFSLEKDADYRLGIHVVPRQACTDCGTVTLRAGSSQKSFSVSGAGPQQIAHLFASPAAGAVEVGLTTVGSRRALGGLVLIREGQINSFDSLEDRLETALYTPGWSAANTPPLPARFVGDGQVGFQALLYRGEAIGLLRQALAAGHRWTVRLGAASYEGLSCGLLDMNGVRGSRVPCSAVFQIDDRTGTGGRLGLYIELDAAAAAKEVAIRYVALASDQARDGDGDGIPEVLDNCPGDWNASQGDCAEIPPEPDAGSDAADGSADAPDSGMAGSGSDAGRDATTPMDGGGSGGAAGASGNAGNAGSGGAGRGGSAGTGGAAPAGEDDSGCGCRTATPRHAGAPALLMLALLTALRAAGARRGRRAG